MKNPRIHKDILVAALQNSLNQARDECLGRPVSRGNKVARPYIKAHLPQAPQFTLTSTSTSTSTVTSCSNFTTTIKNAGVWPQPQPQPARHNVTYPGRRHYWFFLREVNPQHVQRANNSRRGTPQCSSERNGSLEGALGSLRR